MGQAAEEQLKVPEKAQTKQDKMHPNKARSITVGSIPTGQSNIGTASISRSRWRERVSSMHLCLPKVPQKEKKPEASDRAGEWDEINVGKKAPTAMYSTVTSVRWLDANMRGSNSG